ncbi:hypothetical protein [Bradyrhizobium sp. CCBAU 51753]|uniref:hypothetical protein n=1 Tax=Bradyrhizobium sp. CCBAU 51753 TaxID=1325100 RepID=UPI00188BDD0F|nr:hypothetical protein [Bradyrhizobium sp. CCBAU 51753]QOZ25341.1 hypothetical protein XH93_18370 [Bradyrhizobium sp. CCBAU 51753]
MRKGRVLTDEIREKIEQLFASMQKPTAAKIARRLSLKENTVYWYALCNGLLSKKPPSYGRKPYQRNGITINPYTPEHDAMLTEMRIAGHGFTAIAEALTERFGIPRNPHSVHNRSIMLAATADESEAA